MNPHQHIWYVFGSHHYPTGLQHRLLGRVWLKDGNMTVLEDHGLHRHDLSTLPPAEQAKVISRMGNSQRRQLVNAEDMRQGLHPDLLPSLKEPGALPNDLQLAMSKQLAEEEQGPRKSSFEYHREGMPGPQSLDLEGHQAYLDGQQLSPVELKQIVSHIQQGKAKLRHKMRKSEPLAKLEPHLAEALGHVRHAVQTGAMPPQALRAVSRALFTDTMIPTVGNRMAYQDFMSRPREGVHVHLDGNDFGSINKIHDHDTGNQAIVAMGKALRSAMDEAVGRKHGKLFRTGGDEFVAHVPDAERAALFARALRSKLEAIPAVRGTHRLSMSLGFGPTHEHAEEALKDAKAAKKLANAPLGQAKTHAASRMPGREGVIPVD